MDIQTIVKLNSVNGTEESVTDSIETQKNNKPSFMTLTIHEPVVGGDTNGDGEIEVKEILKIGSNGVRALAGSINGVVDSVVGNDVSALPGNADGSVGGVVSTVPENTNVFSNVNTKMSANIALPMPLEISYDDNVNWADDSSAASDLALAAGAQMASLASGSGGVVSGVLAAVSATAFLGAGRKLGQKKLGVGLEPRKEMYFDGPQFREFTFNWEFSPKNSGESQAIRNAVNTIRKYTYPYRLSDDAATIGFEVWKLPATFSISFRYGDDENQFLPKIKPCVVSTVNYNPTKEGSWKSFEDGAPLSSTLSITFKEVEVLTQNDISTSGGSSF